MNRKKDDVSDDVNSVAPQVATDESVTVAAPLNEGDERRDLKLDDLLFNARLRVARNVFDAVAGESVTVIHAEELLQEEATSPDGSPLVVLGCIALAGRSVWFGRSEMGAAYVSRSIGTKFGGSMLVAGGAHSESVLGALPSASSMSFPLTSGVTLVLGPSGSYKSTLVRYFLSETSTGADGALISAFEDTPGAIDIIDDFVMAIAAFLAGRRRVLCVDSVKKLYYINQGSTGEKGLNNLFIQELGGISSVARAIGKALIVVSNLSQNGQDVYEAAYHQTKGSMNVVMLSARDDSFGGSKSMLSYRVDEPAERAIDVRYALPDDIVRYATHGPSVANNNDESNRISYVIGAATRFPEDTTVGASLNKLIASRAQQAARDTGNDLDND